MHAIANTVWIRKSFLYNGKITYVALQLIQPKLYAHTNIKTHYDTLEVPSESTQDEIKSAYYKLSMLYHPDKNKSELAKRKFQNISEAYEVLSNHQARKRYDRSMMIIKHNVKTTETSKNIYTHASIYKSKTHPMDHKYFNYDAWFKQHYGESFSRTYTERMHFKQEEEQEKNEHKEDKNNLITFVLSTVLITSSIMVIAVYINVEVAKRKLVEKNKR